jgi:antitoxin component YwqK of YwqJK toxin-antitoxin module
MRIFFTTLFLVFISCFAFGEVVKTFYPNGQLCSEISYENGLRQGSCIYYWKSDFFWERGPKMTVSEYEKGKLIGEFKSFYSNGILKQHGYYKFVDNELYSRKDSTWKNYNLNGQLIMESSLKNDVQVHWKTYDSFGELIQKGETIFKNGHPVDQKVYDSKGNLQTNLSGC